MSKTIKFSDFEYEQLLVVLEDFNSGANWNDNTATKIGKSWVNKLVNKMEAVPKLEDRTCDCDCHDLHVLGIDQDNHCIFCEQK